MEQGVNEVEVLLMRLKKTTTELIPSFEEIVERQAEKLARKQRKEMRNMFKTEQEDANNEYKKMKLETEKLIKDIRKCTRKKAEEIRREHKSNLRAIVQKERLKNSEQLENATKETRIQTITEEKYCAEFHSKETSENSDSVPSMSPGCAACGKESTWLYFCAACKFTRYCNEMCQTKDWEKHKDTCVGLYHSQLQE